ncbi:hypothetical protein [Candidatus Amarolinea dominans]|uniref:hypothetical protein n=1 Tax=Candidatus Amarolinea dominans TaxID=3140696 RepID=UPI0031CC9597
MAANQNGQFNDPFVPMMWCRDASDNLTFLRQRVQANTGPVSAGHYDTLRLGPLRLLLVRES